MLDWCSRCPLLYRHRNHFAITAVFLRPARLEQSFGVEFQIVTREEIKDRFSDDSERLIWANLAAV
jgi:hypothetical protein